MQGKVIIGGLLCLGAEDFFCKPRCKPECSESSTGLLVPERRSQHLAGSPVAPAGADIQGSWMRVGVGMLMVQAGGGPGFLRQSAASGGIRLTGSLLVPSPYTHTHTHTYTHTPLAIHRCPSLQCDKLTITHDPEGWELWLQLGGGWISQGMTHHSFQFKPEPRDKRGHCQQLELRPSP